MSTIKWLAAISLISVPVLLTSCDTIECGQGTIEADGECVPADGVSPDSDSCGEGTSYDNTLQTCVPDLPPTVCNPDSTEAIVDEFGVIHCEGTGQVGCAITCPQPDAGKLSVCGQIRDTETNMDLKAGEGALCDPASPTDSGPCSLQLKFYDALEFAQDPTGAPELPFDEIKINDCGVFVAVNIPAPALGFLGVGIDDSDSGSVDNYVLAGVALPASGGERLNDLVGWVVRKDTDDAWTTNAGDPFGGTNFSVRGAYVPIFLGPGATPTDDLVPVAGVVATENGTPQPSEDYYFTDTDPNTRTMLSATPTMTGINGSGVLVDSELVNHSGVGAEPAGCEWPTDLADAIPGVMFVSLREAVDTGTGEVCR